MTRRGNPLMVRFARRARFGAMVGTAALLLATGCRKASEAAGDAVAPRTPQEAASQLEQVFKNAAPEIKQGAATASSAMRAGDYEKAVVALQVIRSGSGTNVTFEQGLAVHYSVVAMERKLINAVEAGDENAKRAYKVLKELKRN